MKRALAIFLCLCMMVPAIGLTLVAPVSAAPGDYYLKDIDFYYDATSIGGGMQAVGTFDAINLVNYGFAQSQEGRVGVQMDIYVDGDEELRPYYTKGQENPGVNNQDGQFELTSSGYNDVNELARHTQNMFAWKWGEWNRQVIDLASFSLANGGTFDPTNWNYMRIYYSLMQGGQSIAGLGSYKVNLKICNVRLVNLKAQKPAGWDDESTWGEPNRFTPAAPVWTLYNIGNGFDNDEKQILAGYNLADYVTAHPDQCGTEITDYAPIIQSLVDGLAAAGGGNLFIPAGHYPCYTQIRMKPGVSIYGEWNNPDTTPAITGTVIDVYYGKGKTSGSAFLTLSTSSMVKDVAFWYPEQEYVNPDAYAPTVLLGTHSWAKDITFVNSYTALRFGPAFGNSPNAQNIYGTPLYMGAQLDAAIDIMRIENVNFAAKYWENSGLADAPTAARAKTELEDWLYNNATGVSSARIDWSYLTYITVDGYFHGVTLASNASGTANGQTHDLLLKNCKVGLYVEDTNICSEMITNSTIEDCETGIYFINTNEGSKTGTIQLINLNISASKYAIVSEQASTIQLMSSTIEEGAVTIADGWFMATNTTFETAAPQVVLELDAISASFVGCKDGNGAAIVVDNQGYAKLTQDATAANVGAVPTVNGKEIYKAGNGAAIVYNGAMTDAGIQNALNNMGGNKVLYLPTGDYTISGQITVPAGVELRGVMDFATMAYNAGTRFHVTNTTNAAVVLKEGAGIRGIVFDYPNQGTSSFTAYPYAIEGDGANVFVVNVALRNAWNGVDLMTNDCDNHYVSGVVGTALNNMVQVGGGSANGVVRNCHVNNHAVNSASAYGWNTGNADSEAVYRQVQANAVMYKFGNTTNELIYQNMNYGGAAGVQFVAERGTGSASPIVFGQSSDVTGIPLDIQAGTNIKVVNQQMVSGTTLKFGDENNPRTVRPAENYWVKTSSNFNSTVEIFGSVDWDGPGYGYKLAGGTVTAYGISFLSWGARVANVSAGTLNLINAYWRHGNDVGSQGTTTLDIGSGLDKINMNQGLYTENSIPSSTALATYKNVDLRLTRQDTPKNAAINTANPLVFTEAFTTGYKGESTVGEGVVFENGAATIESAMTMTTKSFVTESGAGANYIVDMRLSPNTLADGAAVRVKINSTDALVISKDNASAGKWYRVIIALNQVQGRGYNYTAYLLDDNYNVLSAGEATSYGTTKVSNLTVAADTGCKAFVDYIIVTKGTYTEGDNAGTGYYANGGSTIGSTIGTTSIANYAFYKRNITSVGINDAITSIGDYAFYKTEDLETVEIPTSVTSIGTDAFLFSGVKKIVYAGTKAQWNALEKSNFADYGSDIEILYGDLGTLIAKLPTYENAESIIDSTLKQNFDNAVAAAKLVNADANATTEQIDAAYDALVAARDALFNTSAVGYIDFRQGYDNNNTVISTVIPEIDPADKRKPGSYRAGNSGVVGMTVDSENETLGWFKVDVSKLTGGEETKLEVTVNYNWTISWEPINREWSFIAISDDEHYSKNGGNGSTQVIISDVVAPAAANNFQESFICGHSQCSDTPMIETATATIDGVTNLVRFSGCMAGPNFTVTEITVRKADSDFVPVQEQLAAKYAEAVATLKLVPQSSAAEALADAVAEADTVLNNFNVKTVLDAAYADLSEALTACGDKSALRALIKAQGTYEGAESILDATKKSNYDAALASAQAVMDDWTLSQTDVDAAYDALAAAQAALFGTYKDGSYTFGETAADTVTEGNIGALTDLHTWGHDCSYGTQPSTGTGLFPLGDSGNPLYWFQIDTSAITGGVATDLEVEVVYGWHNTWGNGSDPEGKKKFMGVCRSELVNLSQSGASGARLTDGETYFVVGTNFSKDYINYDEAHCLGSPASSQYNTTVFPVNGAKNSITFFGFMFGRDCVCIHSITVRPALKANNDLRAQVTVAQNVLKDAEEGEKKAALEDAITMANVVADNFYDAATVNAAIDALNEAIYAIAADKTALSALIAAQPSYAGAESVLDATKKSTYDTALATAQSIVADDTVKDQDVVDAAAAALKAAQDALFGVYKDGKYTFGATADATGKTGYIGALTDLKTWGQSLSYGTNKDNITGTGLIPLPDFGWPLNWFKIDTSAITGGVATDLEVEINYGWHNAYGGVAERKVMGVCRSELATGATANDRLTDGETSFVIGSSFNAWEYNADQCLGVPNNGSNNTTVFPVKGAKNSVTVFGYFGGDSVALVIHSITIRPAETGKKDLQATVAAAEEVLETMSGAKKEALEGAIAAANVVIDTFYAEDAIAAAKAAIVAALADAGADKTELAALIAAQPTYAGVESLLDATKKSTYDAALASAQAVMDDLTIMDQTVVNNAKAALEAAQEALFGKAPVVGTIKFTSDAEEVNNGVISIKGTNSAEIKKANTSGTGPMGLVCTGETSNWFQVDVSKLTGGNTTNLTVSFKYNWTIGWEPVNRQYSFIAVGRAGTFNRYGASGERFFFNTNQKYVNGYSENCYVPECDSHNLDNGALIEEATLTIADVTDTIQFGGGMWGPNFVVTEIAISKASDAAATKVKDDLAAEITAAEAKLLVAKDGTTKTALEAAIAVANAAKDNFYDATVLNAANANLAQAGLAALVADQPSYAGAEAYLDATKKAAYDEALSAAQALLNSNDAAAVDAAYDALAAAQDALFGAHKTGKYTFGATADATVKEGYIGTLTDLKTWGHALSYGTNKDNITGTGLIPLGDTGHSLNWFQIDTSAITGGVAMDLEVEINYGWHSSYGGNAARKIMGVCRSELVNNAVDATCYARMEDSYFVKGASFDPDLDVYNRHYTDAYCLGVPNDGMYNTTVFPVNGAKNSVTVFGFFGGDPVALVIHSITIRPADPEIKGTLATQITTAQAFVGTMADGTAKDDLSAAIVAAQAAYDNFYATDVLTAANEDLIAKMVVVPTSDKTALAAALANAIEDLSGYTSASAAAYSAAVSTAQTVMAKDDATQEEVDAAVQGLATATSGLVEKAQSKAALQTALATFAGETKLDTTYTEDTVAAYRAAAETAQTVFDNADATQAEVDAATSDLNAKYSELYLKLKFATYNLALGSSIALNVKADKSITDLYEDVHVEYVIPETFYGLAAVEGVAEPTEDGTRLSFQVRGIAAERMSYAIDIYLCGTHNGKEYRTLLQKSVRDYCLSRLTTIAKNANPSAKMIAEREVIANMLAYGVAAQQYSATTYSYDLAEDQLATYGMTDVQKSWISTDMRTLEKNNDSKYATVDNPTIKFSSVSLIMSDYVKVRLKLDRALAEGEYVSVTDKDGFERVQITECDASNYILFTGAFANEMSEPFFYTVRDADGNAISNTFKYTIETFAAGRKDTQKDYAMTMAMMRYGLACAVYAPPQ